MTITLKAARINKGLKQDEAAKLLGIAKTTLIRWEKGIRFPDVNQLKKIEEIYDVCYNDIFFASEFHLKRNKT